MSRIETERLILREWEDKDIPAFQKLNADPKVMEFFPATLNDEESIKLLSKIRERFVTNGYCFFACELKENNDVIGFVGLNIPQDQFFFSPCVEIGWRIRTEYQKQGLAREAAHASLEYGFNTLDLKEIVAFTTVTNLPSQGLMKRLGMTKHPQHFNHPSLAADHPLAEHVVYTFTKQNWLQNL